MRTLTIAFTALILTGCDAASQIAGEAVEGEMRNAVAGQCEQVAENAGIVAGRVGDVCRCTADAFIDDPELTIEDISRANIEAIVNDCAVRNASAEAQ